jgi:glycosyltransferase involved in cell wall biosynthesis
MRILNLSESSSAGGISSTVYWMARGFAEEANAGTIQIITAALSVRPTGWLFDRMKQDRLDLVWVACGKPPDCGVIGRIVDLIDRYEIDILHTNGCRGDFYVRSMFDLRLKRRPHVITRHGLPVVQPLTNKVYSILDWRPTRLADRVIAVDSHTRDWLRNDWSVSPDKVRLIHNAAPTFRGPSADVLEKMRCDLGLRKDGLVALYLGRLSGEKGLFELIEAHRSLECRGKAVELLIVGNGYLKDDLMRIAQSHPAGRDIKFIEEQLSVAPYLALCDVLVLPSYQEGLPMVVLEAMSAGKPVIATSVGGIPDLIEDGINGILVAPHDPVSLKKAFEYLLERPEAAAEMGRRGLDLVRNDFSLSQAVRALTKLYAELV